MFNHELSMNVLVTGAAGFIGSHTVDELLRRGATVVGIDNLRSGSMRNLAGALRIPRFTFLQEDVTDEPLLAEVFLKHDIAAVVHLAAMASVAESIRDPEGHFRLNVAAVDCVARAAIRHQCLRFVFASSAAVYGAPARLPLSEDTPCKPISPYGAGKLAAEAILAGYASSHALEVYCFRYFNAYGPRQDPASEYAGVISKFAASLAAHEALTIFGDGEQTRDFVYVGDVASVNASAVFSRSGAGPFNVSTATEISIHQLARALAAELGVTARLHYAAPRPADIPRSCGDNTRLLASGLAGSLTCLKDGLARSAHALRPTHGQGEMIS